MKTWTRRALLGAASLLALGVLATPSAKAQATFQAIPSSAPSHCAASDLEIDHIQIDGLTLRFTMRNASASPIVDAGVHLKGQVGVSIQELGAWWDSIGAWEEIPVEIISDDPWTLHAFWLCSFPTTTPEDEDPDPIGVCGSPMPTGGVPMPCP